MELPDGILERVMAYHPCLRFAGKHFATQQFCRDRVVLLERLWQPAKKLQMRWEAATYTYLRVMRPHDQRVVLQKELMVCGTNTCWVRYYARDRFGIYFWFIAK